MLQRFLLHFLGLTWLPLASLRCFFFSFSSFFFSPPYHQLSGTQLGDEGIRSEVKDRPVGSTLSKMKQHNLGQGHKMKNRQGQALIFVCSSFYVHVQSRVVTFWVIRSTFCTLSCLSCCCIGSCLAMFCSFILCRRKSCKAQDRFAVLVNYMGMMLVLTW